MKAHVQAVEIGGALADEGSDDVIQCRVRHRRACDGDEIAFNLLEEYSRGEPADLDRARQYRGRDVELTVSASFQGRIRAF